MNNNSKDIKDIRYQLIRFVNHWPFYLISIVGFLVIAFLFNRYSNYLYSTVGKIEIVDKAQDSEMALPTSMTIFNRSMINLENEISVLNSYSLHSKVVKKLNANVRYFSIGNIKTTEDHISQWDDLLVNFLIDTDTLDRRLSFSLEKSEDNYKIIKFNNDDSIKEYVFDINSKELSNVDLPFSISIIKNISTEKFGDRLLKIIPVESSIGFFRNKISLSQIGNNSDQISLELIHENRLIAEDYVNTLINEFDKDGIVDRQQEYKNTMDFVDTRSVFLTQELELIENKKQEFKKQNKLFDISINANRNLTSQESYNTKLFETKSQKELTKILKNEIDNNKFNLVPINIGIDDTSINTLLSEYNLLVGQLERYSLTIGENNLIIKNLKSKLTSYLDNIDNSITTYQKSLDIIIDDLEQKELELAALSDQVPENEKLLRKIERELEIKEALFLLLLQKREEAAINYAVVKPSIKIIDRAMSGKTPIYPNTRMVYILAIFAGFLFPTSLLLLLFTLNNKIHTRDDISNNLSSDIPVLAEIPFIDKFDTSQDPFSNKDSRSPIAEAIRMINTNIKFNLNIDKSNTILVTSSIKGEGKTIISTCFSYLLSQNVNSKVILVGSDLRNPQIHKYLGISKDVKGLTDYIYNPNENKLDELIIKKDNLDILLSGTIPANPTLILESDAYKNLIDKFKNEYDFIIIDSAPCLLVSDTFEISKYADSTLYIVRSNHTQIDVLNFIENSFKNKKLNDINLVLNGVGNSSIYGYKYGYQYGYQYGYKYGYNYGYGYGYNSDDN